MASEILQLALFGERNSGTNYLQSLLEHHFALPLTENFGFKHWYIKGLQPRGADNTTTDRQCLLPLDDISAHSTLFIYIIRSPFTWLESMYETPHHIRPNNSSNISEFIHQKLRCSEPAPPYGHGPFSRTAWSLHPQKRDYFIEEADNIIQLRNMKNRHFQRLSQVVDNFVLIRMENMLEDLQALQAKFNLPLKTSDIELVDYREPKERNLLSTVDKNFVREQLDNYYDNEYYLN